MTIIAVETAIQKIREMAKEWDDVELNYWREDQTRYALIDPIIRAFGIHPTRKNAIQSIPAPIRRVAQTIACSALLTSTPSGTTPFLLT